MRHMFHCIVACMIACASTSSASAAAMRMDAPPPSPPFTDFRQQLPGAVHKIAPSDLPAPYATKAVGNGPRMVPRPTDAWPKAPPGFKVELFAKDLKNPRQIRVAPNGNVFVAEMGAGRIRVLEPIPGPHAEPPLRETFIDGLNEPFGMAFYPSGAEPQWLYVGNTDSIVRIPYRNGDTKARGKPEKLAELPAGGGHTTRDLVFSADGKRLFVAVGSRSNIDDPDTTPEERGRANILVFNPDGGDKRVFASGIRNPVGLALDPQTGQLWASVNERDMLGDNLVPDYITHVHEGGFYGWPWWYIGANQDPRHAGKHPELKHQVIVPDVLIQPHNASLGLTFYEGSQFPEEYRGDLFAAEHGSWNRATRTGYEVIRIPRHGHAQASGEYQDFLTGFVLDDGSVWGRPVGVAVAGDGSLLVTDDGSGSIWRVSYVNAKGKD